MVFSMIRNFFRGSSKPNLSMYPAKGNCRFPNIMDQLANGSVESVNVPQGCYLAERWKIGINVKQIDGEMHLVPFITSKYRNYSRHRIEYYLGIKNTKYRIKMNVYLQEEWQAPGFDMKISELKPELLDDGALVVEYGIRLEAVQGALKIWNFHFLIDSSDSEVEQIMIPFWENGNMRCHPQIKAIHYDNSFGNIHYPLGHLAYICLQIAHGVRFQHFIYDIPWSNFDARQMGFRNVIQYSQWYLIQNPLIGPGIKKFSVALENDMRIYLAHLIREMDSKEELMEILKEEDINKMSGESMKTFMKFLLFE